MNQIRINRKRSTIFIIAILVTVIAMTATGSIAQQRATPLDQLMAEKTARVNNGYVDNGTATYPVPVKLQDEIEYEIKVKLPTASVAAQYDFLFLIDWSPSMDSGYNPGEDGSTTGNHAYGARNKATILARTISKDLFDLYPGSRAAMLAMNSNIHNQGNTGYSTTQVDTDFMTDPNRLPLGTTVGVSKLFFDDTAIFMRAATDKFRGNAREYGGLASLHSGGKVAPKVNINPRRDRNRTPVLVFLSDFQLGMNEPETKGSWDLYNQYVKDFIKYCPGGILVSARADTRESRFNGNNGTYGKYYATPKHDAAMDSTVELGGKRADGSDRWGWVKFTEGQSQEDQNKLVLDMLKDKLAVPPPSGDIIDLLPEGLEYISSSPAGTKTTVNGRDRVIWDYAIFPPGETAVTVKAKVKDYGIFINTGDVVVQGYNPVTTNQTYHEAKKPSQPNTPSYVVELFREEGNIGNTLAPDNTIEIPYQADYTPGAGTPPDMLFKDSTRYDYVGYQIDGGPFIQNPPPKPTIAKVVKDHAIVYYYRVKIDMLHIRQVVIDRNNSTIELPKIGYMQLDNTGVSRNITTESGAHGVGTTPFTDYRLTPDPLTPNNLFYRVTDIVPQYYEYAGYVATTTDAAHDPKDLQTNLLILDYGVNAEYWVTMYIRPKATNPGDYTWDFRTNEFGRIYGPPRYNEP